MEVMEGATTTAVGAAGTEARTAEAATVGPTKAVVAAATRHTITTPATTPPIRDTIIATE